MDEFDYTPELPDYETRRDLYKGLISHLDKVVWGEKFDLPRSDSGQYTAALNPVEAFDREKFPEGMIFSEPDTKWTESATGRGGPGWQSRTLDWLAGRLGKAPKRASIESWQAKLKGAGLPESERKTLEPIFNDFGPKDIVSGEELAFMAERIRDLPTQGIVTQELSEDTVNRYTKTYAKVRKLDKEIDDKAYNIAMGKGDPDEYDKLSKLRDRIRVIKDDVADKAEAAEPKWKQYNLDEVTNKREVLYKQRGSTYTNADIETHYQGKLGEGLQWHQREGKINFPEGQSTHLTEQQSDLVSEYIKGGEVYKLQTVHGTEQFNSYDEANDFIMGNWSKREWDELRQSLYKTKAHVPAPTLGENYYKTGFRDLVNRAVREDSKFISWDTADTQIKRWPAGEGTEKFFRQHYDEKLVKMAAKEYGVKPEKITLSGSTGRYFEPRVDFAEDGLEQIPLTQLRVVRNDEGMFEIQRQLGNHDRPIWEHLGELNHETAESAWQFIDRNAKGGDREVWRIPITDDIKRKVLFEGQYFSKKKPEDEFSRPYDVA